MSVVCWCRRTIKSINWPFTFEFINIDPRTNDWPLISSPVPGLTILGAYLYFILSWGPRYMANRKPHKLENVLIAYNLIQVIVSTYIFYEVNLLLVLSNREWEKKSCYNNAFKDRVSPDLVFTFGGCFVFVFHFAETVTYKMYSMYQLCIRKVSRSINSFFLLICWFFFLYFSWIQGAFHGWFAHYNWRCQPVNTSTGPDGIRVCVHRPFIDGSFYAHCLERFSEMNSEKTTVMSIGLCHR